MNCKLLLLDNTTAITSPWKRVLGENFLTAEAVGGFEALTRLKNEAFDLIITNISLVDLNGVEAVRKIREKFYFIPIIVLYNKADCLNLKQVKAYGVQQAMILPVDVKQLIIIISQLIPAARLNEKSLNQQNKEQGDCVKAGRCEAFVNIEDKFYEGLSAVATLNYRTAIEIYEFILQLTNIKHETWMRYVFEAHFQLGQCYANCRDYDASNRHYTAFIAKAPNHNFVRESLLNMGKNHEALQNITKASYYYQKVLNMRPMDACTTQARKLLAKLAKTS